MQGLPWCYSPFYRNVSETPELARFHRYLEYWSWILYNRTSDITKQIEECNGIIAEIQGFTRDRRAFTVADYHRAYARDEHPFLKAKLEVLEKSIRRYGKPLSTLVVILFAYV
jgi:hypothetical protein